MGAPAPVDRSEGRLGCGSAGRLPRVANSRRRAPGGAGVPTHQGSADRREVDGRRRASCQLRPEVSRLFMTRVHRGADRNEFVPLTCQPLPEPLSSPARPCAPLRVLWVDQNPPRKGNHRRTQQEAVHYFIHLLSSRFERLERYLVVEAIK